MSVVGKVARAFVVAWGMLALAGASAAQLGNSGSVEGTVKDVSGGAVGKATVQISNAVSGYTRTMVTEADGTFRFTNVPYNPYHLAITAQGFARYAEEVDVRSAVPVSLQVTLKIATAGETVIVETSGDLVERDPTDHTDVARELFTRVPLESASSSLSSLVTQVSAGVVADSDGLFHSFGEHADNAFSIDGQPITDQQSKVFSNQLPVEAVGSLEVISGVPPANFGGKNSLVINVTTQSGLEQSLHGALTGGYGTFGSSNYGFNFSGGTKTWGNFFTASGLDTGRFLDPPEFQVIHSRGNLENLFDRMDLRAGKSDTFHVNAGFTRSWFQTPNSLDAGAVNQDQRSQIRSFNVAPGWTHLFNTSTLLTVAAWFRKDFVNYYPSADPFADLPVTVSQYRTLANTGVRTDLSYVKGAHNIKFGGEFKHTFLKESFQVGITDPAFNSPCITPNPAGDFVGVGDATLTDPSQCAGAGFEANTAANPDAGAFVPVFDPTLLPFDLSRGGGVLGFNGHTDIKEAALYFIDDITWKSWNFNLGVRGDEYHGLSHGAWFEPRLGASYYIKKTSTLLRFGYGKMLETPFNENLVLSSTPSIGGVAVTDLLGAFSASPVSPGRRNQFNVGFEQGIGKHLVVDAQYYWKFTRNAYDFDVLLGTPITFPIAWDKSKIYGFSVRVSMPNFHGLSLYDVFANTNSRFFFPEVGGLAFDNTPGGVFRIDHDEAFESTFHLQYQPKRTLPWIGFNWRYDSGLVAGAVPFATDTTTPVDLTVLSADQQIQAGLFCGSVFPTLTAPLVTCAPSQYGSTRIALPAPGTENDDHNPPRIGARNLFDVAIGDDNLFHGDKYKWSARVTVINVANKVALYNFLSTFSGTHFVTPRTVTAELGFHF